jgi:hypothetical protein
MGAKVTDNDARHRLATSLILHIEARPHRTVQIKDAN